MQARGGGARKRARNRRAAQPKRAGGEEGTDARRRAERWQNQKKKANQQWRNVPGLSKPPNRQTGGEEADPAETQRTERARMWRVRRGGGTEKRGAAAKRPGAGQ